MNNSHITVSVSQFGARRRYLIPQILEENGVLSALYTDTNTYSPLGIIGSKLNKLGVTLPRLQRLSKRIPNISKEKIFSSDLWQCKILFASLFNKNKVLDSVYQGGAKQFIRHGISSDWLYAMFIENIEFTEYAKAQGVKIIADIYENPFIFKTLIQELENTPEYQPIQYLKTKIKAEADLRAKYTDRLLKIADIYLIPSNYVNSALKESPEYCEQKAHIIPYPSSVRPGGLSNKPIKGRIIWVGNDPVRKGLVYALRAFNALKQKFPYVELRVIGPVPDILKESNYFKDVTFTGYLNKSQLVNELNNADINIFPTLSEGFAGSLIESASYGIPIITTHASGFEADAPCMFVDTHNVDQIVDTVTFLLLNREKRDAMSKSLYDYAQTFRGNRFSNQLFELLKNY